MHPAVRTLIENSLSNELQRLECQKQELASAEKYLEASKRRVKETEVMIAAYEKALKE
jgi:hypothetical protein